MGKSLRDKVTNLKIWRCTGAEFIGTLFLVVIMSGLNSQPWIIRDSDNPPMSEYLVRSAVYGLAVMSISGSIQHVSGAHVNPAITVASLIVRKISIIRAFFYIVAQSAASVLAAAILYSTIGIRDLHTQNLNLNIWQMAGVELLMTFLYALVFFASIDKAKGKESTTLNLGAAVFLASLFAIPHTGGYLNPARLLGPSLLLNKWDRHWIYWAGPILGATVAGILYDVFFASNASVRRTITCLSSCSYDSEAKTTRETYKIHARQSEREKLKSDEDTRNTTEQV